MIGYTNEEAVKTVKKLSFDENGDLSYGKFLYSTKQ
jgi:hypothetical protein